MRRAHGGARAVPRVRRVRGKGTACLEWRQSTTRARQEQTIPHSARRRRVASGRRGRKRREDDNKPGSMGGGGWRAAVRAPPAPPLRCRSRPTKRGRGRRRRDRERHRGFIARPLSLDLGRPSSRGGGCPRARARDGRRRKPERRRRCHRGDVARRERDGAGARATAMTTRTALASAL